MVFICLCLCEDPVWMRAPCGEATHLSWRHGHSLLSLAPSKSVVVVLVVEVILRVLVVILVVIVLVGIVPAAVVLVLAY